MGFAGSPYIFQGKMLELMQSLEYVGAYLDDLLFISKLSLEDHLEKKRRGTQATLQRWTKS